MTTQEKVKAVWPDAWLSPYEAVWRSQEWEDKDDADYGPIVGFGGWDEAALHPAVMEHWRKKEAKE